MYSFSIKIDYLNSILQSEDWVPFTAIEFSVGIQGKRGSTLYEPTAGGHKAMVF